METLGIVIVIFLFVAVIAVIGLVLFVKHHLWVEKQEREEKEAENTREQKALKEKMEYQKQQAEKAREEKEQRAKAIKVLKDNVAIINLTVKNGKGKNRGCVDINVGWSTVPFCQCELNLLKSEGTPLLTVDDICASAEILDGKVRDRTIEYVDSHVELNKIYNYYAVISAQVPGDRDRMVIEWRRNPPHRVYDGELDEAPAEPEGATVEAMRARMHAFNSAGKQYDEFKDEFDREADKFKWSPVLREKVWGEICKEFNLI